jgi:hypothetical protein
MGNIDVITMSIEMSLRMATVGRWGPNSWAWLGQKGLRKFFVRVLRYGSFVIVENTHVTERENGNGSQAKANGCKGM